MKCRTCRGMGFEPLADDPRETVRCHACHGTGKPPFELRRDDGYYSVFHVKTGKRLVDRESLTIAERVCDMANCSMPLDCSESAEVAQQLQRWANA